MALARLWSRLRSGTSGSRRWVLLAVNGLVAVAFPIYMGRRMVLDAQQVLALGLEINVVPLVQAALLYGLNFFLFLVAWRNIAARMGAAPSWRQNALIYATTHAAQYLPTPAWMVLGRLYFYGRTGLRRRLTLTMTATEVILHVGAGLVLLASITFRPLEPQTWGSLLLLAPVGLVVARPRWLELPWLNGAASGPGVRRLDVLFWLGLYFVSWLVAGPFLGLMAQAYPHLEPAPMVELYRIWIFSGLVAYASAYTLGGAGFLREFTLSWLLAGRYGPAMALVIALTLRLVFTAAGILWGLGTAAVLRLGGGVEPGVPQAVPDLEETL
jgi:hypothetical protein